MSFFQCNMYYMLFVYDVYCLFGLCFMLCYIFSEACFIIFGTRRSGRYAPILLAPAEGWGPSAPSRVAMS